MIADVFPLDINGALLAGLGACLAGVGVIPVRLHGMADRTESRT